MSEVEDVTIKLAKACVSYDDDNQPQEWWFAPLLREAIAEIGALRVAKETVVENAVGLLSGGCADHGKLSFEAFTAAGGGDCSICLRASLRRVEEERDEAVKVLAPFAGFADVLDRQGVRGTWVQFDLGDKYPQQTIQDWRGRGKTAHPDDKDVITAVEELVGGNCAAPLCFGDFRALASLHARLSHKHPTETERSE